MASYTTPWDTINVGPETGFECSRNGQAAVK